MILQILAGTLAKNFIYSNGTMAENDQTMSPKLTNSDGPFFENPKLTGDMIIIMKVCH